MFDTRGGCRQGRSCMDEGCFRIVCVMPGRPRKGDAERPFPAKPAAVCEELLKKFNNDLIEVEIRAVPEELQHDRYLVVHNGAVVVSSSKGFDFLPGEPSELGFRRLEKGDVVSEILKAKLLTDRPVNPLMADKLREAYVFVQSTARNY